MPLPGRLGSRCVRPVHDAAPTDAAVRDPVSDSLLSRRGELSRMRRVAESALDRFAVRDARLKLLRHEHNTTFRVDTHGARYVLRVSRAGGHDISVVASEMAWLRALRDDTDLRVPEPVATTDGSFVVDVSDPGDSEPRPCVLLRWQAGRFADEGLRPTHMAAVGTLLGRLQQHAAQWALPAGFVRPHVDAITVAARRASVSSPSQPGERPRHPTTTDVDHALELVARILSPADAALVGRALDRVGETTRGLWASPASSGLIHGDLHYENFLFSAGEAIAIDFDDCGWGPYLYDVAVTLSELEERPIYPSLRETLLNTYVRYRPLPADFETHLHALSVLRRVQLLLWILESRDQAAFREEWRAWAGEELDALRRDVG
jgi:Ser/Thr protein kinase RdoA (MazF antagonist)